jgi:hypothetical protein
MTEKLFMSGTEGAEGMSMNNEFTKKVSRRLASADDGSASAFRTDSNPHSLLQMGLTMLSSVAKRSN